MKLNKNLALSDSGFAFNGSTGDSFLLNETALFILSKIKSNLSKEDIIKAITEEFDVSPTTAEKDFLDFVNQLRIYDLLEE